MEIETVDIKVDDSDEVSGSRTMNLVPVNLMQLHETRNPTQSTPQSKTVRLHQVYPMAGINQSSSKSKYYKQTYRPAWEQMPDFKGWLTAVAGQPRRAYCTYCQKTLHAHRLSLLKHTCTIRHQRAAQAHSLRKRKQGNKPPTQEQTVQTVFVTDETDILLQEHEANNVDYAEHDFENLQELEESMLDEPEEENEQPELDGSDIEEEEQAIDNYDSLSEGATELDNINDISKENNMQYLPAKGKQSTSFDPPSNILGPISTKVIDTTHGAPATGLAVSLYRLIEGRWTYVNEGLTNLNGKIGSFVESNFVLGRYKLHYDVDRYFESRGIDSVFPFIEVVFDMTTTSENFTVLLSPNSYTSYRG